MNNQIIAQDGAKSMIIKFYAKMRKTQKAADRQMNIGLPELLCPKWQGGGNAKIGDIKSS